MAARALVPAVAPSELAVGPLVAFVWLAQLLPVVRRPRTAIAMILRAVLVTTGFGAVLIGALYLGQK